jgi:MADS-box transcription factor
MPEWGFGRGDSGGGNLLPSPLNFQTPVNATGPSFRTENSAEKRKADELEREDSALAASGQVKRIKT